VSFVKFPITTAGLPTPLVSILSAFLRKPVLTDGPLVPLLSTSLSLSAVEASHLHRLLLAYYRILHANRELPYILFWPLSALSQLFWTPHPDTGVRLLAIRCYALQSGMGEAEREKLEIEVLGEICGVDCPIDYGQEVDGGRKEVDGWILPITEAKRVTDARSAIVLEPQDYYSLEDGDFSQPIQLRSVLSYYQCTYCIESYVSQSLNSKCSRGTSSAIIKLSRNLIPAHINADSRTVIARFRDPNFSQTPHVAHLPAIFGEVASLIASRVYSPSRR
jgi:hypothetical protein